MSALSLLHGLLLLQLLTGVALGLARMADALGCSARDGVRLGRVLQFGVLLLAVGLPLLPRASWSPPVARVVAHEDAGLLALSLGAPRPAADPVVVASQAGVDLVALVAAGLLVLLGLGLLRQVRGLFVQVRRTHLQRRIGRVELRLSTRGSFAAWLPGRSIVAIDVRAWPDLSERRLVLLHELQHHRHGDARWAWLSRVLHVLCLGSPLLRAWMRHQRALEELAVDAALVARPDVRRLAYADTLLRAAARPPLGLVAGLATPTLLHRRIDMIHTPTRARRGALSLSLSLALALGALATTAWAGRLAVEVDPGLSSSLVAAGDDAFPIPTTEPVVDQLHALTASPRGRVFAARALAAHAVHAERVDAALARHGLPPQLAAVPFVESGYANLTANPDPRYPGAGLWQFIPETARSYGLVVDGQIDERIDPDRATEAAARLLADLHAEFGDWGLALAAYNQGPDAVRAAIAAEGSRDITALIQAGALHDYAARVFAAAALLEDPMQLP